MRGCAYLNVDFALPGEPATPTLAWAGHRSPDIFYIFAELTLAALTFVGTGTAINIVVNADTTTISLNGTKREEDWL